MYLLYFGMSSWKWVYLLSGGHKSIHSRAVTNPIYLVLSAYTDIPKMILLEQMGY